MQEFKIKTNLQAAYDEQYTADMTAWRELGAKYKAQNIVDLCASLNIEKALEVGAGEGSILKFLNEWSFCDELHALEISQSGINRIQERALSRVKSVQSFDGYIIPYGDDTFDLAILSHVLEHVEFPRLLLRELHRVARYVVIEVPCDFSFNVDQNVEHFLSYGHINVFVPTVLKFLLRTEHFQVVEDLCLLALFLLVL